MNILEQLRTALSGAYDIERQIGSGGMGSVFLGRDRTLDRPVAIKVINPEVSASSAVRERFLQEARLIARLQHPNIVGVYAAGETGGLVYFIMEYVAGESLRERLDRERRLPPEQARAILADLARALAFAHARGIVHRDIKPENVLLADSGEAKLADFGVARALSAAGESRMTGTGMVVGTPRYMSPEQASGERTIDGRSDIYSLGLIGYELLAGGPAFVGDTPASVIARQITTPPPPLRGRSAEVPADLEAVIEKAIEKDPANRWQRAAELERALVGDAASVSLATGPRLARRRRRAVLGSAAVVAVAAIAALVVWFTGRSGVPEGVDPRKSFLVIPFDNQTGDPALGWLREGSMNMLTLNLGSWRDLKVVDYERTLDLLRADGLDSSSRIGLAAAREVARRAGAWTVVMGQLARVADSLVVTARVYDVARGEPLRRATVLSIPVRADPRALFDRLSRELLDIAGAPAMTPELAKTTSQSLEAYKAYLAGVTALNEVLLDSADRSLARAIAADSSFALAWYKRAVGAGWRPQPGDTSSIHYSRMAARHADRLPARERKLIDAHLALVLGLARLATPDGKSQLETARTLFTELVTADSLDAEAWYGLADAHFHMPSTQGTARVADLTGALRGFSRVLRIDSTFHLAYPHLVEIHAIAANSQVPIVMVGDSLVWSPPGDPGGLDGAALEQARVAARRRLLGVAERWVAIDPDSPEAYDRLTTAYQTVGRMDRAVEALRGAMSRMGNRRPDLAYRLATLEMAAGDTAAPATLRDAIRRFPAESLARASVFRIPAVFAAAAVGSYHGSSRLMDSTFALIERTDSVLRLGSGAEMRFRVFGDAFQALHEGAMGVEFSGIKPRVDAAIRELDRLGPSAAAEIQGLKMLIPFYAFALSSDSTYGLQLQRWSGSSAARTLPASVRAINALRRGDTAAAERIARDFARGDTTKYRADGPGMLDPFFEAEVLTILGDARGALAAYESIQPRHFSIYGYPDLRWPLLARSWMARARLYEQVGDRANAERSYERFITIWNGADPRFQPQVRAAREALARLRDAPR